MAVYYSMILWVVFIGLIGEFSATLKKNELGEYEKHISKVFVFIAMAYIVFMVGMRSGVGDTPAYIKMFDDMPSNITLFSPEQYTKDRGFTILSILFKQFISQDYHVWLFTIAVISGLAVAKGVYKYSSNYFYSLFLFIVMVQFVWMLNGMRQFIVVSILFCNLDLIVDRKPIRFFILVALLSTIHVTALIMIPVYFYAQIKPFTMEQLIAIVIILVVGLSIDKIAAAFSYTLEDTAYEGYLDAAATSNGSNILRSMVAMCPFVLAWFGRKNILDKKSKLIDVSINMSLASGLLYFISSLSGGILIGRLPIYFDMYNIILLPWLIQNIFEIKEKRLVYFIVSLCSIAFFYYKVKVGMGMDYVSDILNLYVK
ncbi:EpsG family protein [uncultured Intestinibacter sp.]|uniref:EpsG family protein n=1 Tax=uncultured Intestinibacter sp. TaxID=1505659 RepID=UPI0027DDC69E|nr:EpsG family protein [uncultured Intestinibacter sp.]